MAVTSDHSANLPREFFPCPYCDKRGAYVLTPKHRNAVERSLAGLDYIGWRCKYCGSQRFVKRGEWMGIESELELERQFAEAPARAEIVRSQ